MRKFIYHRGNLFHCPANWTWKGCDFRDYDIWLVTDGRGRLTNPGKSYELGRGDCFIFSPGDRHCAVHDPDFPLSVIAIHFGIAEGGAGIRLPYHSKIGQSAVLFELLHRSVVFAREQEMQKAEFWLEAAINFCCETAEKPEAGEETIHARKIEEICRRILRNPAERCCVSRLAGECFLSPDHFTRLFRQRKGCSPKEFMIRCRIGYACELLQESSMEIADIAALSGYKNVYFFSSQFKKLTGMAPGKYRKSLRTTANPDWNSGASR